MDQEEYQAWLEHPITKVVKAFMKEAVEEAETHRNELNPMGMVPDEFLKFSIAYLATREALEEVDNLLTKEGYELLEVEDNERPE